jgi:hypothetical protein
VPGTPIYEPLYDDWPSLECPHWLPDKETAFRAPVRAERFVVRLVTWGEPTQPFQDAVETAQWHLPGFVEAWDFVESARSWWDSVGQRIVVEWMCQEEDPGFADSTAELIAHYYDRVMAVEIEGFTWGQTAIVDVFVPE